MAAEYTAFSADMLRDAKGREPTKGELYAAHFLGPWGAVDMMKAAMRGEPNAAALFPDAARANKPIFYDKAGNPRSPTELLAKLDGMIDGVKTPAVPDLNTIPARQMVAEFRPSMEERQKIVDAQIAASARKELRLERAMPGDDETKAALAVPEIGDAQASITSAIFTQLVASLDFLPTRENDPAFRRDRRSDEIFQRAAA